MTGARNLEHIWSVSIESSFFLRFGTYSVDQAIQAGLDLEMPGPPRWRTPLLVNHTLGAQKIAVEDINARVYALLSFVQKLAAKNPEVVFGDGVERSKDSPESRRFCRKLTAETMVLLKIRRTSYHYVQTK